jgi:hypothetical protein
MKRLLVLAIFIVSVSSLFYISAYAEKPQQHSSDKVVDYYMLSSFSNQINKAVRDFYNNDSVTVGYFHPSKQDAVQVFQSEKGYNLGYPYVVKITVYSSDGTKRLGTDTITFGSYPLEKNNENLAAMKTEMIDFKHKEPK